MGYWVILVHSMPLLLLPVLQLSGGLNLGVMLVLLVSFIRTWRLQVRQQHPDAVCSLRWGDDKHCLLELRSGKQQQCELCQQVFLTPWLVILYFKRTRYGRRSLVLFPDMVNGEPFRRLRVRLKLEINTP